MIDLLSFVLGLLAAGIPLGLLLPWFCDKAWWLGVHDHLFRKYQACKNVCASCELWRTCLQKNREEAS